MMRVDPRSCKCEVKEHIWWALLHDIIVHPLLGFTLYRSQLIIRLHDYTSHKAWPRKRSTGVMYQSAVSGLWYSNRLAAGDISAVRIDWDWEDADG